MAKVTMQAGQLASVAQAFKMLEGQRPIQLSFNIGKILQEVDAAHELFVEKIRPLLNDDGTFDSDNEQAAAILQEEVTLDVPVVTLGSLEAASLTVADDAALIFLTSTGVVQTD